VHFYIVALLFRQFELLRYFHYIQYIINVLFVSISARQGPGSAAETKRALDLLGAEKDAPLQALDVGCGTGAQTFVLAEKTNWNITAVGIFAEFLEILEERAVSMGLAERVSVSSQSMDSLSFEGQFDVIWSEGAAYSMGFASAVREWRRFLKTGGALAVSEISWLTGSRPGELEKFWTEAYPQIDTVSNKIRVLEKSGYSPAAYFALPEYCWLEEYYHFAEARFDDFLARHQCSSEAAAFVEGEKQEIALYKKYKEYYGYGFYLARKKQLFKAQPVPPQGK
jgi:cyclopropane fatty-acyl-phospholipid synthase-like methyltransferase